MKTLIVQNLTHRGTVPAEGFLFSAKLLTESEMRRRILALWQANAVVFRRGEDLILMFSQSIRVDCRNAVGLPLVRYGEILSSFPLRKTDLHFFEKSGETLLLSNEGRIETSLFQDLKGESVENWFDISDFQTVETETLGEVKTKPVIIEKIEAIDLRQELKNVPPANSEMAEILEVLRRKNEERAVSRTSSGFSHGNPPSLRESFGGIFDSLRNLFSGKDGQNRRSFENPPENTPGALRRFFTKALFQMKIAQILGRKQAQYLAKMMEMFENGDLEEALKHAIPLEDMQALKQMSEQMPFLGFLRPRDNLQINYSKQNASGSGVFLEDQWFDNLRVLYRQTFERLVAQNRIEEAAFVLEELLKSHHEAVEFLEKHGKFRLAAQLAEARDLSKEIIVRQWFLAGEKRLAIRLAVLYNCFEYVVTKLEQENHAQAAELREIWAENLAASGNFKAAINTIWKLEDKREIAADWIDKVIEFGGAAAAEMLVKKITLFPGSFEDVKTKLLEILAETGDEARETRAAFARETLQLVPNPELRKLVPPLARRILADSAAGGRHFSPEDLRRLVEVAQDYTLRTDLPKLPQDKSEKTSETFKLEIAENNKGAIRVFDAVSLPNGKTAVALGEAGVKILSKKGKTIAHFDQPTERFIVSDSGTKAVCLARRGGVWRLAKVDFVEKKAKYWCDASIENFAPTFDGNLWFIAEKDDLYAIDANAWNFEAIWRVAEIGGHGWKIYEIARSSSKLMLLVFEEKGFEKWWYDLPKYVLRSRNQVKWLALDNENQAFHSVGSFIAYSIVQIEEIVEESLKFEAKIFDYDHFMGKIDFPPETIGAGKPQIVEKVFALTSITENAVFIDLYEISKNHIAGFKLPKSENFSVKLDEKYLVITDDEGRVIIFDYKEKLLRRNIRL